MTSTIEACSKENLTYFICVKRGLRRCSESHSLLLIKSGPPFVSHQIRISDIYLCTQAFTRGFTLVVLKLMRMVVKERQCSVKVASFDNASRRF